jgi:hypothetical protein
MKKLKLPRPSNENKEVHIEVESWRWQTTPSRFTWKHWLILGVFLATAFLFAFGFLIVAAVLVVVGAVLNIILFLLRKLS